MLLWLLSSLCLAAHQKTLTAMLKPCEFYLIVQLFLAAPITADWSCQRNLFSSNGGNRPHPEIIPLRFDLPHSHTPDSGKWLTHPDRNSTFKHSKCTFNTRVVQTGPVCVPGSCISQDAIPFYLTHSDSLSHNDTFQTEITSKQQHSTFREHNNEYRFEIIVIMEEDPVVTESAIYIYKRQPSVSALLRYKKGALHVLRGRHFFPTGSHNVILVGHGVKEGGSAQLAGYNSEELAIFMSVLKTQNILGNLNTISLISCNLGNDQEFMLRLLKVLQSLGVETKLQLYNSLLSVSSDGEIMTTTDGVWRSHDLSRRITAELDHRGDLLTRVEFGCAGPMFPDYKGHVLYLQSLDWPSHPQMFVPMELRKKYPSIDCLEGLTWSLFFEESERRRAPDFVQDNSKGHMEAIWLIELGPKEQENIVFKHIVSIQDLLVEIRYHAREEVTSGLFYVLNYCIYKVHSKSLNVTMVGKFIGTENVAEINYFLQNFKGQQNESSLQELRLGLKASKFTDFCRQTFQYHQCSYNCERWGHYFMAAVFSASVRNFRTFSLFLMSVIGCEVGHLRGTDSRLCTAFVEDDHPMVTEQPWPDHLRRGFYGCTVDNYDMAPQNIQIWLDQVVSKENALYIKSKQIMNAVNHDEQTELEIFGKVKVMNKYVFSSYLEFFRGTPEGKKLKRGCTPIF